MKVCTRHWTFYEIFIHKKSHNKRRMKKKWLSRPFPGDLWSKYVCQLSNKCEETKDKKLIMIKNWWKRTQNGLEKKQECNGSSNCCISLEDLNATRGSPSASILHSSLIIKKLSLNFLTRVSRYKSTNLLPSMWEKKKGCFLTEKSL